MISSGRKYHPWLIFISLIATSLTGISQEMGGVVTDRFSAINRSFLNPAALAQSENCLEISFLTGNAGLQNNYFFLRKEEFNLGKLYQELRDQETFTFDDIGENENLAALRAGQYARFRGPAILWRYNNHSFAFAASSAIYSHVRRFPVHVMKFIIEGLDYSPQIDQVFSETRPFSAASISWGDLSFSYATTLSKNSIGSHTAGITVKRLWAWHAAAFRSENLQYAVNNFQDVNLVNFNATGFFSLPFIDNINDTDINPANVNGKGWSADVGWSYTHNREYTARQRSSSGRGSAGNGNPYAFRTGISLIDWGYVTMNNNTGAFAFTDASLTIERPAWDDFRTFDDVLFDLENRLLSGTIDYGYRESFSIVLPSAISIQHDQFLADNVYLAALVVQDIPLGKNKIYRPSYMGVIPRYETRFFSIAFPFTLYDYTLLRMGVAMRVGILTIGTDQPGGLLKINDLGGADVYFSLRWNVESCKGKKQRGSHCSDFW